MPWRYPCLLLPTRLEQWQLASNRRLGAYELLLFVPHGKATAKKTLPVETVENQTLLFRYILVTFGNRSRWQLCDCGEQTSSGTVPTPGRS